MSAAPPKQALRRLGQRLRREPATRVAMEQLEANPSDPAVQERLAEQLTGKLKDPAFREDLQGLLDELDRQAAAAATAEDPVQEIGEGHAGPPDAPAAAARAGTRSVRDELVGYLEDLGQRAPGGMVGVPTGFPDLDRLTGGLQDGTLIVVAGPTAAGVSTFGLTLARMAAIRAAVPTLVFSLDLTGGTGDPPAAVCGRVDRFPAAAAGPPRRTGLGAANSTARPRRRCAVDDRCLADHDRGRHLDRLPAVS